MNQLLFVIGGWLGLLSRASLLLQLLLGIALLLGYRAWRLRNPSAVSWRPVLAKLALGALVALASLVLTKLGWPGGLLALLGQLVAIWTGLAVLRLLLRRRLDGGAVESYWQRAVLPLYLVLALVGLVNRIDGIEAISDVPLLNLFDENLSFGKFVLLLGLPYFLVVLSELPVALVGGLAARLGGIEMGNRKAFELILRYLLIGIGGLWLADQIGLNGTAIAAIAGGLSVGLGFGVKEVFSNFVSGLWLLFEGSVKPGELLVLQDDICKVKSLGLRAATLTRSSDNAELVVPNQTFFTATTTTYTGSDERRCGTVQVRAAYKHDPDRVIALLLDTARANPLVLTDPAPGAKLSNFGEHFMEYKLDFWMADPLKSGSISSQLRQQIWHRFREQGIEIPLQSGVIAQAS
jgi:small-conductance mechanosensitive channel